jgi:hypothetical protein
MKLLAGHLSHVLGPTSLLNVCMPQSVHVSGGPVKLMLHEHCSLPGGDTLFNGQGRHAFTLDRAKAAENVLLGHAVHAELPATALYVPKGHFSHQSGQIFVTTSVPRTCISFSVTWPSAGLRTYR